MIGWDIFAFTFGSLSILCAIADILLYDYEKNAFRDYLVDLWIRLNIRKISDIPGKIAKYTIDFYYKIFGFKYTSLRTIIITIMVSFLFTFFAVMCGRYLEVKSEINAIESFSNTLIDLIPFIGFYKSQLLFPLNFIFDYLTIIVTIQIMKFICIYKDFANRLFLIISDIFIACIFAVSTIIGIKMITEISRTGDFNFLMPVGAVLRTITTFNVFILGKAGIRDYESFFFGLTTLFPTLLYLFFYIALLLVHTIEKIFNKIFINMLERIHANVDKLIFSKLAVLFASFFGLSNYIIGRFYQFMKH